jgi:hypothetical protein
LSKRLIVLLAGVVAIAVVAAGCGSSSDDSTETTAALTKAVFIKQGDAICVKGDKSLEAEADEFAKENDIDTNKPTTEQQEEVVSDVVGPAIREQGEEIDALGAPSGDEEQVEAIVAAVTSGAEEMEADPSSLTDKNPLAEATKLAKEYGFKSCGQ